ncbi:MAG: VWA domain-containing protein [Anaerolineae bacterium]|nr:VWA domain-containing protein [Anaerolineae bacterium]
MKRRPIIHLMLFALLACLVPVALAQSGARLEFDQTGEGDRSPEVRDGDFPRLGFTLTPMSGSGVPFDGLSPSAFTVLEDGSPAKNFTVTERVDPNQGISVVLVLDVSGSMFDDIDALRTAAAALYDRVLEQTDESAIITFATLADGTTVNLSDPFPQLTAGREVGFTNDEGMLKNLINGMVIDEGAGTPLYDAIYKGARMANAEASNTRRVVIVMTDGVDADRQGNVEKGSTVYDRESVIDELRTLNVPVFTVGLGDEIDSAFLQRVANTTGGTYQNAPLASDLADIFTEVASQLKVKYDLSFTASTLSDGQLHNLQVSARTPDGEVSKTVAYLANYPVQPWVQGVQAANPRQDFRALDTFESVKGRVALQPTIVARGDIAAVNYYINDQLVYTADTSPWEFSWNTTDLAPDETHRLTIEALDDATPANAGRADFDLLVEACSIICLVEQQSGVPAAWWLAGLIALLLLFVLFLWRRRRHVPEPITSYETPIYTPPVVEPAPPPPAAPQQPKLGATEVMAGTAGPAAARPRAKTEVLSRRQGPIAFLIDVETGRQFPLGEVTTIGSGTENDVVLDESTVSGQHAKVRIEDGSFALFDLGSTNGTLVNGSTIARHVLADGDRVQFGRKTLTFRVMS